MEKELNIAAILKEKPEGTKLWSPMIGECKLLEVENNDNFDFPIRVFNKKEGTVVFRKDGKYSKCGEVCLFPSRWMDDWQKFAWKKGDVLICGFDNLCIFDKWYNEEYTEFEAKFASPDYGGAVLKTHNCRKALNESTIKQYISKIEEIKGGKLNLETLEIEHPKQELKDGDIVVLDGSKEKNLAKIIFIYSDGISFNNYVLLNVSHEIIHFRSNVLTIGRTPRLATEEEKQQLFSALAKEGKRWNPETKAIEDLPKKCEFKAFDKVLVKISGRTWTADFFSHYDENDEELPYVCIGYGRVAHCIPYNKETAHLLGTTDEWKGGEG